MSLWTYIHGTIIVSPMGRTQHEKTYILNTVLDHLPQVTGSERCMNVYVIQKEGYDHINSCDEFGKVTNNLIDSYGDKSFKNGWLRTQSQYILVVDASLRDRVFEQTLKEFNKWLCRLAKRISVEDVLVEIKGCYGQLLIRNKNDVYGKMFDDVSWYDNSSKNWCEYLMW